MPDVGYQALADFVSLFKGKDTAYGVHIPDGADRKEEGGKLRGRSFTRTGNVTINSYTDHLAGVQGLGVVPITDNDKCWFGAIDVDVYSGDRTALLRRVERSGIPLCPFQSKSGGTHLFVFLSEDSPILAGRLILLLSEVRDILGLAADTELFPKQRTVKGVVGNWINLPYFGDTDRKCIAVDGSLMPFDEAMALCTRRRVSDDSFTRAIDETPFADGPPCLQTLALDDSIPARNNYLFSAARYYKAKFGEDAFPDHVRKLNETLDPPLEEKELKATVIASHMKKDYSYKCKDSPLCERCLKVKCKTRKFGVGSAQVSELDFGPIWQYMTDPPYYEWEINGKRIKFYSETDLISQRYFQEQCVRHLNIKPAQLGAPVWDMVLNTALKNITVKRIDAGSEMSEGATFKEYLGEFLTERSMAVSRIHILVDKVFLDTERDAYVFRASALNRFLFDQKKFTLLKRSQVMDRLVSLCGEQARYYIDPAHRSVAVWTIPRLAVQDIAEGRVERVEVDFLEDMAEEF